VPEFLNLNIYSLGHDYQISISLENVSTMYNHLIYAFEKEIILKERLEIVRKELGV
jgi:hypothetical protein